MLQATHFTLHSCVCNWLLSKYVGGLGVKLWRGNEEKEVRGRENWGWVYISVQTTTTSITGEDETQGATCQNTSPDEEEFLTHLSFACVQLGFL